VFFFVVICGKSTLITCMMHSLEAKNKVINAKTTGNLGWMELGRNQA